MKRYELTEGIEKAFALHYKERDLQAAAYTEWPELTFVGADTIMAALAENLWRYRRPPDSRFLQWATAWVRRQTRRHRFLTELFTNNHQLVYAAIQRGLSKCPAQDWAVEPCDIESEIFIYLLTTPRVIDDLMKPKTAKSSSMLYKLASKHTRSYHTSLNADRRGLVLKWMADLLNSGMSGDPPEPKKKKDAYEKKAMQCELAGTR